MIGSAVPRCPAPIHLLLGSEKESALPPEGAPCGSGSTLGQGRLQREGGRGGWRDLAWAPEWFWKPKNNLFLKQADWFALEGLCVRSVYKYQNK